MTKSDVLKMAVQLTAGELSGPTGVNLLMNGSGAVQRRITEFTQLIVDVGIVMGLEIEEDPK